MFTYKREIWGRGFVRAYPVNEVFNLRATGLFPDSATTFSDSLARWGLGGGTVAVDTKYGDTYRFGIQLREFDAVALAKTLEPYLRRNI